MMAALSATPDASPLRLDQNVSDHGVLRRAFGHYPSGVAAIAATVAGERTVLVSSSFMVGISLEPPLVTFAVQHTSESWPQLLKAAHLGVSVLSADQGDLCRQLSGRDRRRRFAGVNVVAHGEALLFEKASSWMVCRMHDVVGAGDHDIVVLRVEATATDPSRDPLVFQGSSFRPLKAEPHEADGTPR